MPARDVIHDAVRNALVKDGWTITDDPYILELEELVVFADLGADRSLGAQRGDERLVIEAKSFQGRSVVYELEHAIGQYQLYRILLETLDPGTPLYLAVSEEVYESVFLGRGVKVVVESIGVSLVVIDLENEAIIKWIK